MRNWYFVKIEYKNGYSILEYRNRQYWRKKTALKHMEDIKKTWGKNLHVYLEIV